MVETYIVYFLLLFLCTTLSVACKAKNIDARFFIGYLMPILVVSIIFGGRYETGTDWSNYKDYFDEISKYHIEGVLYGSLEPLYVLLNKVIASIGFGSSSFFAIIAAFQFTVVYILFKEDKALLPLAIFFYTVANLSLNMNIVRQALAISIVLLASSYVSGRWRIIKRAALVVVAIGFHYSALICAPIIFIDSKVFKHLDRSRLIVVLYFLSIILAGIIRQYLSGLVQMIEFGSKYDQNASNLDQVMDVSTGYGLFAKHILNLTMVLLWTRVRSFVSKSVYFNAYRISVIGVLLFNIFGISVYLSRMALYYSQFQFVVWTVICYNVFCNKSLRNYSLLGYGIIVIYLMMFAVGIYHGDGGISPYNYKWISRIDYK